MNLFVPILSFIGLRDRTFWVNNTLKGAFLALFFSPIEQKTQSCAVYSLKRGSSTLSKYSFNGPFGMVLRPSSASNRWEKNNEQKRYTFNLSNCSRYLSSSLLLPPPPLRSFAKQWTILQSHIRQEEGRRRPFLLLLMLLLQDSFLICYIQVLT